MMAVPLSPRLEPHRRARAGTPLQPGQAVHAKRDKADAGALRGSFTKPPGDGLRGSGGLSRSGIAEQRSYSEGGVWERQGGGATLKRSNSLTEASVKESESSVRRRSGWFSGISLEGVLADLSCAVQGSLEQVLATSTSAPTLPKLSEKSYKMSYCYECEEGVVVQMYSPTVYQWIRAKAGVSQAQWLKSWQGKFSVHGSSGKSGASFAKAGDGRFFLKSLTADELKVMRDVIHGLCGHFAKSDNSLINRPFGLFSVSVNGTKFHFVALANIFHPNAPLAAMYDLKGSTQGRAAKAEEHRKKVPLLKDVDWQNTNAFVKVPTQTYDRLAAALKADCAFFTKHGLMDYSLFVGACKKTGLQATGGSTLLTSDGASYYMGIIDYLQVYNLGKKIAHAAKGVVNDVATISTIPPADYAERFERFMLSTVFSPPSGRTPAEIPMPTAPSGASGKARNPPTLKPRAAKQPAAAVGNGTFSHAPSHMSRVLPVPTSLSAEPVARNPLFSTPSLSGSGPSRVSREANVVRVGGPPAGPVLRRRIAAHRKPAAASSATAASSKAAASSATAAPTSSSPRVKSTPTTKPSAKPKAASKPSGKKSGQPKAAKK